MMFRRVLLTPFEFEFIVQCIELALPHLDEKRRHFAQLVLSAFDSSPKSDYVEAKMSVIIKFVFNMILARLPTFRS